MLVKGVVEIDAAVNEASSTLWSLIGEGDRLWPIPVGRWSAEEELGPPWVVREEVTRVHLLTHRPGVHTPKDLVLGGEDAD